MTTATMYSVGPCPICGDGLRGVRVCCGRLVIVCDECDAVWATPELTDRISTRGEPQCAQCQKSLWGEQARWADWEEIGRAGWSHLAGSPLRETSADRPDHRSRQRLVSTPESHARGDRDSASGWVIFGLLLLGTALAAVAVL